MRCYVMVLVLAGFGLAGCVAATGGLPVVAPTDSAAVAATATVERNPHTGVTTISNPLIMPYGSILADTYLIRSWIDPTNPAMNNRFQIYVQAYMSDWKFLSQAYANGKPLDTTKIGTNVLSCRNGCSMTETVGINLSKADVRRYADTGLSFQVSGRRGEVTLTIPGSYFAGALQSHDQAAKPSGA